MSKIFDLEWVLGLLGAAFVAVVIAVFMRFVSGDWLSYGELGFIVAVNALAAHWSHLMREHSA